MIKRVIIFISISLFCGFFVYSLQTPRKTAQGYDLEYGQEYDLRYDKEYAQDYDLSYGQDYDQEYDSDYGGLITSSLFGGNGSDLTTPSVRRLREDENTIIKTIEFTQPSISKITINGASYDRITMDGLENIGNPGEPLLPIKTLKIFIPLDKSVVFTRIAQHEKIQIPGTYHIEPAQEETPLANFDTTKTTQPDQSIYGSSKAFPEQSYKIITKQKMYNYEIYIFNLYPIVYEPQTGKLSYYRSLSLVVNLTPKSEDLINSTLSYPLSFGYFFPSKSKKYESRIKQFVDNPDIVSTPSFNTSLLRKRRYKASLPTGRYEYIIITDKLFENAFQPLIDSKIAKGLTAKTVTTQYIYNNSDIEGSDGGSDNQAKIRAFIRQAHIQWGTEYVLLGGDIEIIPCRKLYYDHCISLEDEFRRWCSNNIASDLYYACLDGTFDPNQNGIYAEIGDETGEEIDLLAEVFIGRAPVSTTKEVENFVQKTLLHETINTDTWKNLMVGEYLGYYYNPKKRTYIHAYAKPYLEEIKLGSDENDYSTIGIDQSEITSDCLYDFDLMQYDLDARWEKKTLLDAMNDSNTHFYNHFGHSFVNENMRLTRHDIYTLTNTTPFFIYSQGCHSASFDNVDQKGNITPYDSIAEEFIKSPHGAFAYIGNTRFGWFDIDSTNGSSQRFHRYFWDFIIAKGVRQLGRANQLSKEANIGLIKEKTYRWCYLQLTLLGDPELSIGDFSAGGCAFTIAPTDGSFDYTDPNFKFECFGREASFQVITSNECLWEAESDSNWIEIISGKSATGTGNVNFRVLENPQINDYRSGNIIIKDENNQAKAVSFEVIQKRCPCIYRVSFPGTDCASAAGEASFEVITDNGCSWKAVSGCSWITIISGTSGRGSGTIYFKFPANPSTSDRTGQIIIKDKEDNIQETFWVKQEGRCDYSLSPISQDFECTGGVDSFRVNTQMGCTWTALIAAIDSVWLQLTSGASGSGTATVYYKVTENSASSARTGTITIKDENGKVQATFTVNQSHSPVTTYPNPVPDTGQTTSYTDTFGEDSDYTINPHSYTKLDAQGKALNENATSWAMVKDNVTGLIWEVKTDDGTIHDMYTKYTWQDAQDKFIAQVNSSRFGGYTDWRMPTIKELSYIIDSGRYNPAIDTDYFPKTISSNYWSSTTHADDPDDAWSVYFYYGGVFYGVKSDSLYVRAVRGGQ